MKIRQGLAAAGIAVLTACTTPTEQDDTAAVTALPEVSIANAVTPTVKIGATVTFADNGWKRSFTGSLNIPSDANVLYAFVYGGASKAPVSGVALGSQTFTKVKSASGPNGSGLSVYRLVSPSTGSGKQVTVTRSAAAYNPTRVTVIAVSGADAANPNGTPPPPSTELRWKYASPAWTSQRSSFRTITAEWPRVWPCMGAAGSVSG